MSPDSVVLLLTLMSQASCLTTTCYFVAPSQLDLDQHARRLRYYPSNNRIQIPSKRSASQYRIRKGAKTVFLKRSRRIPARNRNRYRHYIYGIVPFVIAPDVTKSQRELVLQTMSVFENSTCIRFVDRYLGNGQLSHDFYRLGHNGYIEFVNKAECFSSAVGNIRTRTRVSCCSQSECVPLLGKALGLRAQLQGDEDNGFFRLIPHSIPPKLPNIQQKTFYWDALDGVAPDALYSTSDLQEVNSHSPVNLLTSGVQADAGHFYFLKELSQIYQCQRYNCSKFEDNCSNDGYVRPVNGRCTCKCPEGLEPETNCRTVIRHPGQVPACGGVLRLSDQTPSVSFSSNQDRKSACTWLVNAPEGDTVILDFESFDVARSLGECEDWLEIRYAKIGQTGKVFCGKEGPTSITSHHNRLLVRLVTSPRKGFHSSFSATVRLVSERKLCYNPKDSGYSYAGTIDYARDYSPCAPWWQTTHCQHHPYRFQDMTSRLDSNFCRNPDHSLKPWCYINPTTCRRKYCDVCMLEKPHNALRDCHRIANSTYCSHDKQTARSTCAKECQSQLFKPQASVAAVRCSRPEVPADGIQVNKLTKANFAVGEAVKFRCVHLNRFYRTTLRKYCLSSGNWSDGNSACLPCHLNKGWVMQGQSCYAINRGKKTAEDHQMKCRRQGGDLAEVKSWEEQKFISGFVFSKGIRSYFIGATDKHKEGEFIFRNFAKVLWTNWDPRTVNFKGIDCVAVNVEGLWQHERCQHKAYAVCKAPILRHRRLTGSRCIDFRDDCKKMAALDLKLCSREGGMFAVAQCARTCRLC